LSFEPVTDLRVASEVGGDIYGLNASGGSLDADAVYPSAISASVKRKPP
jgi:hypothetical protein